MDVLHPIDSTNYQIFYYVYIIHNYDPPSSELFPGENHPSAQTIGGQQQEQGPTISGCHPIHLA